MKQVLRIVREHYLALLLPVAVAVAVAALLTAARSRGTVVYEAVAFVETGRGQLGRVASHITQPKIVGLTIQALTNGKWAVPFQGFLKNPAREKPDETEESARQRELQSRLEVEPRN